MDFSCAMHSLDGKKQGAGGLQKDALLEFNSSSSFVSCKAKCWWFTTHLSRVSICERVPYFVIYGLNLIKVLGTSTALRSWEAATRVELVRKQPAAVQVESPMPLWPFLEALPIPSP